MPSSPASALWRCSMSVSVASCVPASAATSSVSSRSVMPLTAECTTSTRVPAASRERTTAAMLRQLAKFETLVPPNLSTTQEDWSRGAIAYPCVRERAGSDLQSILQRLASGSELVVEDVAQVFSQFFVGQHFLEPAPCRLATLALRAHPFVDAGQQTVVIGAVLGLSDEFLVQVEALVIAFRHRIFAEEMSSNQ